MNGPAELDPWELPCTCPVLDDGRATGVYFRDVNRRPGKQWACRKCGGVAPEQPGSDAPTTGVGWPT